MSRTRRWKRVRPSRGCRRRRRKRLPPSGSAEVLSRVSCAASYALSSVRFMSCSPCSAIGHAGAGRVAFRHAPRKPVFPAVARWRLLQRRVAFEPTPLTCNLYVAARRVGVEWRDTASCLQRTCPEYAAVGRTDRIVGAMDAGLKRHAFAARPNLTAGRRARAPCRAPSAPAPGRAAGLRPSAGRRIRSGSGSARIRPAAAG